METRLSILFYGKKAKLTKEGLMPIYLRVTIGGERFDTSTHRYVAPSRWSVEASRVNGKSSDARAINTFLDTLLSKVYNCHQEITRDEKEVNIENFVKKWSGAKEKPVMLLEVFEQHNNKLKDLLGNGYAPATLTKYKTTLDYTRQFIAWKYRVADLALSALGYEFITDFVYWLKSQKKCAHNDHGLKALRNTLDHLSELTLGRTAVGTGIECSGWL